MNYNELREEEKEELRAALYWGGEDCYDYSNLSAEEKEIVYNAESPEDIKEEVMISAYGHYSFVEEDFFCNI